MPSRVDPEQGPAMSAKTGPTAKDRQAAAKGEGSYTVAKGTDISEDVILQNGLDGTTLLAELADRQGFSGLPEVVDDLTPYITAGEVELWRGVSTTEYAEDFKTGEYYSGLLGSMGNGIYTTARQEHAEAYAGEKRALLHMTLRADARVIDYSEARERSFKEMGERATQVVKLAKLGDMPAREARQTFNYWSLLSSNTGAWAAAMGYDAIVERFRSGDTYLVLNRTALRVQK